VYIFRPRLVKDFPLNVGVPAVRYVVPAVNIVKTITLAPDPAVMDTVPGFAVDQEVVRY